MTPEKDRALRLEDAASLAGLSTRTLTREIKRLGIKREWQDAGFLTIRQSDVLRLIEFRKKKAA